MASDFVPPLQATSGRGKIFGDIGEDAWVDHRPVRSRPMLYPNLPRFLQRFESTLRSPRRHKNDTVCSPYNINSTSRPFTSSQLPQPGTLEARQALSGSCFRIVVPNVHVFKVGDAKRLLAEQIGIHSMLLQLYPGTAFGGGATDDSGFTDLQEEDIFDGKEVGGFSQDFFSSLAPGGPAAHHDRESELRDWELLHFALRPPTDESFDSRSCSGSSSSEVCCSSSSDEQKHVRDAQQPQFTCSVAFLALATHPRIDFLKDIFPHRTLGLTDTQLSELESRLVNIGGCGLPVLLRTLFQMHACWGTSSSHPLRKPEEGETCLPNNQDPSGLHLSSELPQCTATVTVMSVPVGRKSQSSTQKSASSAAPSTTVRRSFDVTEDVGPKWFCLGSWAKDTRAVFPAPESVANGDSQDLDSFSESFPDLEGTAFQRQSLLINLSKSDPSTFGQVVWVKEGTPAASRVVIVQDLSCRQKRPHQDGSQLFDKNKIWNTFNAPLSCFSNYSMQPPLSLQAGHNNLDLFERFLLRLENVCRSSGKRGDVPSGFCNTAESVYEEAIRQEIFKCLRKDEIAEAKERHRLQPDAAFNQIYYP